MTIDKAKLKVLAEAATPGRHYDRLESAGGGIKYECTGDDGSLVLKVDHKNDEFGFVGDRGEADEAFFLACSPATILALLAEIERLKERNVYWIDQANTIAVDRNSIRNERDQLKADNEALRKDAELIAAGRAKLAGAMSRLRAKHNDWAAPESLPAAELVWCACGDGFPPNSYGAGFMDANNGVCWSCDAAKEAGHD